MNKITTEDKWLYLLKEAIDNNVKIAMNHKYEYKGYRLGSFLIHAKKRKNKDLYKKIEEIGFVYKYHSKKPEDIVEAYINRLWNDPNPIKARYITRFNKYILPKKNILDKELIYELNVVWRMKFGDKRRWVKPLDHKKRIKLWKKVRYNKEINPKGKWFAGTSNLKPIYHWVFNRRKSREKMNEIAKYFNETEILELINEGFPIDNPYYKKPSYKRVTKEEKKSK